jgi:hypothetical protein
MRSCNILTTLAPRIDGFPTNLDVDLDVNNFRTLIVDYCEECRKLVPPANPDIDRIL